MITKRSALFTTAIFAAIIIYVAFIWAFILRLDTSFSSAKGTPLSGNTVKITSGWQYRWGDSPLDGSEFERTDKDASGEGWNSFQYPGRPKNPGKFDAVWIRTTLPREEIKDAWFRFRAPQQTVEVYLENQLIYKYGKYEPANKVRTPGSDWHFAKLPAGYGGKVIYFRLHTPFPEYNGFLTEIALGNMSSHILDIFAVNFPDIIFGSLFILVGAALIVITLFGSRRWWNIIYLGLSSIFIGGWYIAESRIPLLYFHIPVSIIYAANFFIFLLPVWLLIYIERAYTRQSEPQRLILRILWLAHALLAFLAFTFDIAGLVSTLYFDKVLHVLLVLSMGAAFYSILRAAKNGIKGAVLFVSGVLALGLTGLYDTFIMFYDTAPRLNTTRISYIGMLYFLFVLLVNTGESLKRLYEGMESHSIETEMNYKSLFTNMNEGFTYNKVEFDNAGNVVCCKVLEANDAFLNKTELERDTAIGADLFELLPEIKNLDLSFGTAREECAAASELHASTGSLRFGKRWFKLSAFCPKKGYMSMIFSDVTDIKKAEETIRRQAYTDRLTGFFNRSYFEEVMQKINARLADFKPLSMIVIDIDGMKITNDTFGHSAGDMLLKVAAQILSHVFGSNAIISRMGGDEFCIILPNTSYAAAQDLMEQVISLVKKTNQQNPVIPFSMSIGVTTAGEEDHCNAFEVYKQADDEMSRYKISQTGSEKSKVIDMLLSALSEKDFVSQGHVERLAELCAQMGDALNLHDAQKRNLVLLSKVHDLGKIGIPDEILNKPGRLTPEEYEKMKQHVKIGYNIASRSKVLVAIAPLILHHHEHWSGKGYPDSMAGEKIPLECRILSIIDAFDAMTNDRPYHKGITVQAALEEIRRCAGEQFDPELASKFVDIASNLYAVSPTVL